VRPLKPNLFGVALLRRLKIDWLVGNDCTCLKGVGLHFIESTLSNLPTYFDVGDFRKKMVV
jgi:hypothetical protein